MMKILVYSRKMTKTQVMATKDHIMARAIGALPPIILDGFNACSVRHNLKEDDPLGIYSSGILIHYSLGQ